MASCDHVSVALRELGRIEQGLFILGITDVTVMRVEGTIIPELKGTG